MEKVIFLVFKNLKTKYMKMKVAIKKDGFIYLNEEKLDEMKTLLLLKELIDDAIDDKIDVIWDDNDLRADYRAVVCVGVNRMKIKNGLGWYCSEWKSIADWVSAIEKVVNEVGAWYMGLTEEKGEVCFDSLMKKEVRNERL